MLGHLLNKQQPEIVRPDLPQAVPGLVLRACRGEADYPAMAAVVESCREWDRLDPHSLAEAIPNAGDLARALTLVRGHDRRKNVLIAEVDGAVVGYNIINWWVEKARVPVYHHRGYLMPEWRGKGIGTAMLHRVEARIRKLASAHPRGICAAITTGASSTEKDTTRLLLHEGYFPVQVFSEMALDLARHIPNVYLPHGFELRSARAGDCRAAWEIGRAARARGQGLMAAPEDEYRALQDSPTFDPALWRVAWAGDEIAGVVLCELSGDVGLVTDVCICLSWRGHGLARAILLHALHGLKARGAAQARLIADAGAALTGDTLYASVGFRALKQYTRYRKPLNPA
jgi:mycothiol synthase